jgi:hypothetical protein
LLYKSREKWTINQRERAQILFELYPDIKTVYYLSQQLKSIYNINNDKKGGDVKISALVQKGRRIWIQVIQYNIKNDNQSLPNHIELF